MNTVQNKNFTLQFGDISTAPSPAPTAFLKQVHGATCVVVNAAADREQEGDVVLTSTPGLRIAVRTADCVPLAFYDTQNHAAAMVHAGWRGAVAGVVQAAMKSMHNEFGTTPQNLSAYIGPCARWCCYEVGSEVATLVPPDALSMRDGLMYLDMPTFVQTQLGQAGIAPERVLCEDTCTICTPQYHSYRRDGTDAGRNISMIILN